MRTPFYLLCIAAFLLSAVVLCVDHYSVVIDAGSTGSRAFVFKTEVNTNGQKFVTSHPCGKVRPGLSSFSSNHTGAVAHLLPLLKDAMNIIPKPFRGGTQLYVKGTGGMRILSEEEQRALWDYLVVKLKESEDVTFNVLSTNFGTISGHMEAFYAVLASNYIAGNIDANLNPVAGTKLLGALDMGGSSNQLIMYNGGTPDGKIEAHHFWSHSFLHFGVERIRDRVLDFLHTTHSKSYVDGTLDSRGTRNGDFEKDVSDSESNNGTVRVSVIPNPCGLLNSIVKYNDELVFRGTGKGEECLRIIEQVVWPGSGSNTPTSNSATGERKFESKDDNIVFATMGVDGTVQEELGCVSYPCAVDSVVHPNVGGHHFYAMSVYYYALDCIRQLGPDPLPHWPNPTVAELKEATLKFCAMHWDDLEEEYTLRNKHTYTRSWQLPHRCLESLYIVTLLEKGFGFDQQERAITLALEVEGNEVEWTLGFLLAEVEHECYEDSECHSNPTYQVTTDISNPNEQPDINTVTCSDNSELEQCASPVRFVNTGDEAQSMLSLLVRKFGWLFEQNVM